MGNRASLSQVTLPASPTTSTQAATKAYADLMIPLTQRAAASGVATLDSTTRIPQAQLPLRRGGRWRQDTTGQSIAAATDTKITFNTALDTATGISYSAGVFTVSDAGRWTILASAVYPFTASLETWLWIGPSAATTTRWDVDIRVAPAGSGPGNTMKVHISRVFAASDTFALWTWHNSGSAKTLDVGYGGIVHLEALFDGA